MSGEGRSFSRHRPVPSEFKNSETVTEKAEDEGVYSREH